MLGVLRLLVAFLLITGAGVTTLLLQVGSYVLVRPFSLRAHRRNVTTVSYAFFLQGAFLLQRWARVKLRTYGDLLPEGKSALLIVNHSNNTDFLIGLALLAGLGYPAPGNAKCVVKASLGDVPIFGWILRFCDFIFLTRSWSADRVKFLSKLRGLATYPASGLPLWVVLFPEGSRLTPEKLAKTQKYSLANGYPVFDNVLLPRFKGFTTTVPELRPALDHIVDVTCMIEGHKPSLSNVLTGRSDAIVNLHIHSYNIDNVPQADEDMQNWLLERWREKENRIAQFKSNSSSLGAPHPAAPVPSCLPFYGLVAAFLAGATPVLYMVAQIPNGLRYLAVANGCVVAAVGLFVAFNLKPSKKGK